MACISGRITSIRRSSIRRPPRCGPRGREKVRGRSDDMIIVRGVNVFPTQIEEQILRCEGLSPHYQIELRRDQRLDAMRILVEARAGHADEAARAARGGL